MPIELSAVLADAAALDDSEVGTGLPLLRHPAALLLATVPPAPVPVE